MNINNHYFRRANHTIGGVSILYYAIPPQYLWFQRWYIPVIAIILAGMGEAYRLWRRDLVPGQRDFERDRVASYFYFGTSIVVLLLFFPQQIAVPCILLAAIVDPVLGETRGKFYSVPLAILISILIFGGTGYTAGHWPLIAGGTITALTAELLLRRFVDDDLGVPMFTAVFLMILSSVTPFPDPSISPLEWRW